MSPLTSSMMPLGQFSSQTVLYSGNCLLTVLKWQAHTHTSLSGCFCSGRRGRTASEAAEAASGGRRGRGEARGRPGWWGEGEEEKGLFSTTLHRRERGRKRQGTLNLLNSEGSVVDCRTAKKCHYWKNLKMELCTVKYVVNST